MIYTCPKPELFKPKKGERVEGKDDVKGRSEGSTVGKNAVNADEPLIFLRLVGGGSGGGGKSRKSKDTSL